MGIGVVEIMGWVVWYQQIAALYFSVAWLVNYSTETFSELPHIYERYILQKNESKRPLVPTGGSETIQIWLGVIVNDNDNQVV